MLTWEVGAPYSDVRLPDLEIWAPELDCGVLVSGFGLLGLDFGRSEFFCHHLPSSPLYVLPPHYWLPGLPRLPT
jgi:hypothetical protein